jgi:DNA-binding protein HU-beta
MSRSEEGWRLEGQLKAAHRKSFSGAACAPIRPVAVDIGSSKLNKAEIIEMVAATHELSKVQSKKIVEQVFGVVGATLKKEGRFSFADLGTFTVSERAARKGRNPATGESIKIKASKAVKFKAAPALKAMVAKVKVKK